jgi:Tfp pilus assembly protein PilF
VSVHDHKIAVKPAANEVGGTKKLIGITSINNSNPTALSKAQAYINYVEKFGYAKQYLDSALYYLSKSDPSFKTKYISQLVQIAFLKNDFATITQIAEATTAISQLLNKQEYSNADGWTAYRIGEAYSQVGNPAKALTFYKLAYELTPYSAEFANKYGTALVSNQRITEAKSIFAGLVKEHPEYAPGYSNFGFIVLNTEQDQKKAMEFYEKALLLDPDYVQALINKAGLLIYQQKMNDANSIFKSILKKDPQNAQVKAILSKINTVN